MFTPNQKYLIVSRNNSPSFLGELFDYSGPSHVVLRNCSVIFDCIPIKTVLSTGKGFEQIEPIPGTVHVNIDNRDVYEWTHDLPTESSADKFLST